MPIGLLPAAADRRKIATVRAAWPKPESLPAKWLFSAAALLQYRVPTLQSADCSRLRQNSFPPRLPTHALRQISPPKNLEARLHRGHPTGAMKDRQRRDGDSR